MKNNNCLLLIADGEALTFGIKSLMKSSGIKVDATKTIEKGLSLLNIKQYKVVVIDLSIRESSLEDLEVIKTIKDYQPKCKVIIFAPHFGEDAVKEKALKMGVDLYFEKPGAIGKMKEILHSIGLL